MGQKANNIEMLQSETDLANITPEQASALLLAEIDQQATKVLTNIQASTKHSGPKRSLPNTFLNIPVHLLEATYESLLPKIRAEQNMCNRLIAEAQSQLRPLLYPHGLRERGRNIASPIESHLKIKELELSISQWGYRMTAMRLALRDLEKVVEFKRRGGIGGFVLGGKKNAETFAVEQSDLWVEEREKRFWAEHDFVLNKFKLGRYKDRPGSEG